MYSTLHMYRVYTVIKAMIYDTLYFARLTRFGILAIYTVESYYVAKK